MRHTVRTFVVRSLAMTVLHSLLFVLACETQDDDLVWAGGFTKREGSARVLIEEYTILLDE